MTRVDPSSMPNNYLLRRLPPKEYRRLLPHLEVVPLKFKQILYQARSVIDYVYFPTSGVASTLAIMANGDAIEVANIGNEGFVGLNTLVGADITPNEVIVQVEGAALRMEAGALREAVGRDGPLRRSLMLYNTAFLTQVSYSVACNGLHPIRQRCCRWLLMTHDRVEANEMPLTHEFLAIMLGVRRPSVSEVLHPLQAEGLLRYTRGKITVLDRAGLEAAACECYQSVKDEFHRLLG